MQITASGLFCCPREMTMRQTERTFTMTADEVAKILGVSVPRVWQLGTEGKIRFRSVGTKTRMYDAHSVSMYLIGVDARCRNCSQSSSAHAESADEVSSLTTR